MPKKHCPRKGSLQFWPRKRSKKPYSSVRAWVKAKDAKLLGFAGYKAGMTHVMIRDDSNALTKGESIRQPVTIIECPPLKPFSIRFYKNKHPGSFVVSEIFNPKLDKEIKRRIRIPKRSNTEPKDYDDLRLVVYTQPKLLRAGKKKPEIFEIAIGGHKEEKLKYAKQLLDKDIKLRDVFKEGQMIDARSVTKGKGFQGTIKRYGVKRLHHKSEKKVRGIGSLGPWTPKRVKWTVPQTGKMGYHLRTDYNKWVFRISDNKEDIKIKGGFLGYGFVKNDYLMIKGSVPGPRKRLIIMTEQIKPTRQRKMYVPDIQYVSLESKQ